MTATALTLRDRPTSVFIAEAIEQEMELDDRIVVLGEDVGAMGGVYGATRNLQKRFGNKRVRDTPIAEMAFTGMAVGMAMAGLRPVVEIMFADFIGVCLEQIYNAAAKIPYMSGGEVRMPIAFKTAAGCEGSAAQHSQCMWGLIAHLPGIRVVVPSSPYESKGMMAAAIACDDPVIVFEHKQLLVRKASSFRNGASVPRERYHVSLDSAHIVRPGRDITIATLSSMVEESLDAAEQLAVDGIDCEVVDIRSLVPLDIQTIFESATRTGRLLVVDEDYLSFGLTGELVTRIVERGGLAGISALKRHAVPDVPIPAAASLERAVIPAAGSIMHEVRTMLGAS